ncbi:MAG: hypothetical protein ACUZ8E_15275 [Candidatus Anammoxibacter sp.]
MASRRVEYIISLRDNFSKSLAGINKNLRVTGQRIKSIGQTMSLAVTLPIVALGATAVKLASDFEETESKFFTVFSSIQKQAGETAKNLKDNFGLSGRAALQLLGDTGDLLVGFGFTESAALEMSQQVNELAVDLASFTNVQGGAQSASAALTKALLGERESIKTLGISILESDVKARVLLNTQKGLRFESIRQAKAVATLQLATEQSSKAIGDFERTSGSFANQMRITKARLEDLGIQIGKILLPISKKLLNVIKGWIKSFSNLSPETKKIIVVVAGLAAVLGPLLFIIGILATSVIPGLISVFSALNIVMLANPVFLIIAGIVALTAAIVIAHNKFEGFRNVVNIVSATFKGLFAVISEITSFIFTKLKSAFDFVGNLITSISNKVKSIFGVMGETIKDTLIGPFQAIKSFISGFFDFIVDKIMSFFGFLAKIPGVKKVITTFKNTFQKERKEFFKEENKLAKQVEKSQKIKDGIPTIPTVPVAPKGVTPVTAVAPTKITSAAPKVFNINIEKLVETINNNVTNLKEGMNESKKVITEALLSALNDTQAQVR